MKTRLFGSATRWFCLLLLLTPGCKGSAAEVGGYKCADFVRLSIYYGRSTDERLAEISSYPIDKQYAVFVCGVQYIRPPQWEAAQPFAAHGSVAADFLATKLPLVHDDTTIENIVTLFGDMEARGVYEIAQESELAQLLQQSVSRMKNEVQKKRTQQVLDQLIGN